VVGFRAPPVGWAIGVILGVFRQEPTEGGDTDGSGRFCPSELLAALCAGDGVDLIRVAVRMVIQELIELEAVDAIGAGRYERTAAALAPTSSPQAPVA
jgi:hypothetical protein